MICLIGKQAQITATLIGPFIARTHRQRQTKSYKCSPGFSVNVFSSVAKNVHFCAQGNEERHFVNCRLSADAMMDHYNHFDFCGKHVPLWDL